MSDPSQEWTSPEWKGTREGRALAMFSEAERVDQQPENVDAVDGDFDLLRMYEQKPIAALLPYVSSDYQSQGTGVAVATTGRPVAISPWNVLRSVVNTAWAVISRSKVRGRYITSKGTADQKNRAKAATHWLDGWTAEEKVHREAGKALRDCEVARWGVVKLWKEGGKVKVRRKMPLQISFDVVGSIDGEPQIIYEKGTIARSRLLALYGKGNPERRQAIIDAPRVLVNGQETAADMILYREAYALPSAKGAKDGWHAVAIAGPGGDKSGTDGRCMVIEEYKRDRWPYVFFIWESGITGMGGKSLASQICDMQTRINFMEYVEAAAHRIMLLPRLYMDKRSKIIKSQITNMIGSIIEGTGQAPVALNWNALPQEFYNAKQKVADQMYEVPGISANVAQGTKPEGTQSGVAQQEAQESQNLRIQIYTQLAWEAPIVEIYELATEMAAEIAEETGSYIVQAETRDGVEELDFKKVVHDLKIKKVAIYPSGFLPLTPAARLDYILQMITSGLWDVDRGRQAMSDLDVDSEQSMENQILQMFVKMFEGMLYDGKPAQPTELDVGYYAIALKTAAVYEAMARNEDVKKKNVSLMRRYVSELRRLKGEVDKASAPPPQAVPMMGAAPAQQALPAVTPEAAAAPAAAVPVAA